MRGRWADGIQPRSLIWVIKDLLAICERPGGHGANHRAVRRNEEIIWIRRQDFDFVVSLLTGPHNLHSYDELQMPYIHLPIGEVPTAGSLVAAFEPITLRIEAGERLLVHHERIDDVLAGFLAAYLLWLGRCSDVPSALHATERLLRRPIGQQGRETVTAFAAAGITRGALAVGDDPGSTPVGSGGLGSKVDVPPAKPVRRIGDQ